MVQVQQYTRATVSPQIQKLARKAAYQNKVIPLMHSLPAPKDVPRVEQVQLRQLYSLYVEGIEDPELLDEVESRLVARLQLWIQLHEYGDVVWHTDDWAQDVKGSGAVVGNELITKLADMYGMEMTGQELEFVQEPYERIRAAQRSGNYNRRMLAIDHLVTRVHDAGPLADTFVEGGSRFLDWLSAKQEDIDGDKRWDIFWQDRGD